MSKDVTTFLTEQKAKSPTNHQILTTLRKLVKKTHPTVTERIMYGGIMFALDDKDVGGIFPYAKHVSFEFSEGVNLKDPKKVLEGSGKHRRHMKLVDVKDIDLLEVEEFVEQLG